MITLLLSSIAGLVIVLATYRYYSKRRAISRNRLVLRLEYIEAPHLRLCSGYYIHPLYGSILCSNDLQEIFKVPHYLRPLGPIEAILSTDPFPNSVEVTFTKHNDLVRVNGSLTPTLSTAKNVLREFLREHGVSRAYFGITY